MQRAGAEHNAAKGHQPGNGKFQPQGEQQKDDAKLGQMLNTFSITDPAKAEWAGGQAAEQVGQNGRHAKAPKQHHGCHGGAEQDNNECQGIMHKRVGFPKIQTTSVAARSWQVRTVS